MKKLITATFALLLVIFSVHQLKAYDFTVNGQVLGTEQLVPVPNQEVKLHIHQTQISETALTGEDGTYTITVMIPDSGSFHYVLKTFDECIHHYIIRNGDVIPEGATEDFVVCQNGGGGGQFGCEADFNYFLHPMHPLKVMFHDESDFLPGTWAWDFGDGETSSFKHPQHTYAAAGEYTVTLTINGADSTCVDTYSELIVVEGGQQFGCEAAFTWNTHPHHPLKVMFHDESDFLPGTWVWDFGDGETSSFKHPQHTYAAAGEYTVTLTINGADSTCVDTYSELIVVEGGQQFGCEAAFTWNTHPHQPLRVMFHDESDFLPGTWAWDFGDGETSSFKHPQHTYAAAGEYTVTLTINGADSTCVDTYSETVVVEGNGGGQTPCEAKFIWHESHHTPYKVYFHDKSEFQPGTWYWEFGDGETSTDKNPQHIFAAGGEYTVTLTINGADSTCVDTYSEVIVLETVVFGCEADFNWHESHHTPLKVNFHDESDFLPGTWAWDFGDGATSTDRHPVDQFTAGGQYTVTLTINGADSTCVDTYSEVIVLDTVVFGCEAAFEYHASWHNPMDIHFEDKSDFLPGTWYWEFGDGETSSQKNPHHTYTTGGEFTVTLSVVSADSSCIDTYSEVLVIEDLTMNCEANFWWHHNCQNQNPLEIKFHNNSYTYSPIVELAWDFGDGTTSGEEDPVHVYGDFGLYTVTLGIVTESGCESSKTLDVWVHDPAMNCMANFVPFIDSINPLQVFFQDLSLGDVDSWLYDFGDGTTSDEQNPVHIYPEAAVYTASLTIEAGNCTSSFYYEIDLINGQVVVSPGPTTGINENNTAEVSIWPNPAQDMLFINTDADINVTITNLAGQVLITTNQKAVNVSGLTGGVYFAIINTNGQIVNRKFIK